MKPLETFIGQPIRSLQTMLRVIAEANPQQMSVVPDGIYGRDTVNAVSSFQRRTGLPITGIADDETWNAIVNEYKPSLILVGEAEPIAVIWEPNQVIRRGESHPNIYLAQGMLTVLSHAYASIPKPGFSGELDLTTSQSLLAFQELQEIPITGELDRITWYQLAKHYPLASRLVVAPPPRKTMSNF